MILPPETSEQIRRSRLYLELAEKYPHYDLNRMYLMATGGRTEAEIILACRPLPASTLWEQIR